MPTSSFTERHNIARPEPAIEVHDDAPAEVREAVWRIANQVGIDDYGLWHSIGTRIAVPNYSATSSVSVRVQYVLATCEWFEVYDLAEGIYADLPGVARKTAEAYQRVLNDAFRKLGVGWWMNNGLMERRGTKPFEETVHTALDALHDAKMVTSAGELEKALHDLSTRPKPDVTGAIQHAGAALECAMREICGNPKATLGQLLKDHPGTVPAPLDTAIEKVWGYASEMGRHLREGRTPALEEALLAVQASAAVTTYLLSKWPRP